MHEHIRRDLTPAESRRRAAVEPAPAGPVESRRRSSAPAAPAVRFSADSMAAFIGQPLQLKARWNYTIVQFRAAVDEAYADMDGEMEAHAVAARGTAGGGGALPHLARIQSSFGRHDVTGVAAHAGGAAAEACDELGATAYASGGRVAFASAPDLHTAAHEAAHVVQQRGGVQLKGGIGAARDRYEQHADAVADLVVRGESAEALLDSHAGSGGASGVVQRRAVQLEEDEKKGKKSKKGKKGEKSEKGEKAQDALADEPGDAADKDATGDSTSPACGKLGTKVAPVKGVGLSVATSADCKSVEIAAEAKLSDTVKKIGDGLNKIKFAKTVEIGPIPCYFKISPNFKVKQKFSVGEVYGMSTDIEVGGKATIGSGYADGTVEAGGVFLDMTLTASAGWKVSYDSATETLSGSAVALSIKAGGKVGALRAMVGGVGFDGVSKEIANFELLSVKLGEFEGGEVKLPSWKKGKDVDRLLALLAEHEEEISAANEVLKYASGGMALAEAAGNAVAPAGAEAIGGAVDKLGGTSPRKRSEELNQGLIERQEAETRWGVHFRKFWAPLKDFYDVEQVNGFHTAYVDFLCKSDEKTREIYDRSVMAEDAALEKARAAKNAHHADASVAAENERYAGDVADVKRRLETRVASIGEMYRAAPQVDLKDQYVRARRDGVEDLKEVVSTHIRIMRDRLALNAIETGGTSPEPSNYGDDREPEAEAARIVDETLGSFEDFAARVMSSKPPEDAGDAPEPTVLYPKR